VKGTLAMKRLPIPQREFAFVAETFCLIRDTGVDGERVTRERDELEAARRLSNAAQQRLFRKRTGKKRSATPRAAPKASRRR
jgi:hypothetical protein